MDPGAWLDTDLLRQRRERYGSQRPAVIPVSTLLLRGALIGSALPLILLLTCFWLWLSEGRLRQRAVELQPLADEHDLLEVRIKQEKKVLEDAVQTNRAIGRAMADVRSSSALLGELQRIVPQKIILNQAKINDGALELRGKA